MSVTPTSPLPSKLFFCKPELNTIANLLVLLGKSIPGKYETILQKIDTISIAENRGIYVKVHINITFASSKTDLINNN